MGILFDIILGGIFISFVIFMLSDFTSILFFGNLKNEVKDKDSFHDIFDELKEDKAYFYEHYIPILERINSIIPTLDKNTHINYLAALHLMQMEIHQMQDFVDNGYLTKNMFFIKKNKQFIHMHDIYNEQIKKISAAINKTAKN